MKRTIIVATICIVAVFPLMLNAETHKVTVGNGSFTPNDLVIQPGDTVVWTDAPDPGECSYDPCPVVALHTVKADDLSFSSGPPADGWTYQRTFDQLGEILYHCEVHSAPGKDIDSFMNGRITVQAEVEATFEINPGLNDAWYNPATNGQGFLITVFPELKQLFLAWFTFDIERPAEDVIAFFSAFRVKFRFSVLCRTTCRCARPWPTPEWSKKGGQGIARAALMPVGIGREKISQAFRSASVCFRQWDALRPSAGRLTSRAPASRLRQ